MNTHAFHRLAACSLVSMAASWAAASDQAPALHGAFSKHFRVGVAISTHTLMTPETEALAFARKHFNSATPENCMKWEVIHPEPGQYAFEKADRLVDFCTQNEIDLVGHTLVWHSQTPEWVFQGLDGQPATPELLLARMRDHIHTVVGRFRGRIRAWDVVNEAFNEDGTLRESPWREIIGDDYLEHVFRFAQEADPRAELFYNDYNLYVPEKSRAVARLARRLKSAGCRIDGIGMQGHWGLDQPTCDQIDASVVRFQAVVDKVSISELDVNVLPWPGAVVDADVARRAVGSPELDPYTSGLPAVKQAELAERYAALFGLFIHRSDVIDRVTFWGLDDGRSWHNFWPIEGRTAHSTLFDRSQMPKPAFFAVIEAARQQDHDIESP